MILMGCALIFFVPFLLAADEKVKEAKDAPRILFAMPLAVKPGEKVKVMLRGIKLDSVAEVKSSETVKLLGKGRKAAVPNNYPTVKLGDTECEIELELPKDFSAQFIEIKVLTPGGESQYQLTVAKAIVGESEPNDGFAQAQKLTLPVTIDGKIDKERDVDVFRFEGQAGQEIVAELWAARLGSPADLRLTLFDAGCNILAEGDIRRNEPDPSISFKLPREGIY